MAKEWLIASNQNHRRSVLLFTNLIYEYLFANLEKTPLGLRKINDAKESFYLHCLTVKIFWNKTTKRQPFVWISAYSHNSNKCVSNNSNISIRTSSIIVANQFIIINTEDVRSGLLLHTHAHSINDNCPSNCDATSFVSWERVLDTDDKYDTVVWYCIFLHISS